jgi:putative membrane protein
MNFIDYVTLMLVNMSAGYFLLGCYVWRGLDTEDRVTWAPAFGITGLVATVCGFVMTFKAPLPVPYNMAYGETSVLLGMLFLGTSWALARGWELMPLAIYALFAGAVAVVLGVRIIELNLTQYAILSGVGFILSGAAGVCAPLVVWQSEQKGLRIISSLLLFAVSAIWALTAALAYWDHIAKK